jgi:hypothetical protein
MVASISFSSAWHATRRRKLTRINGDLPMTAWRTTLGRRTALLPHAGFAPGLKPNLNEWKGSACRSGAGLPRPGRRSDMPPAPYIIIGD